MNKNDSILIIIIVVIAVGLIVVPNFVLSGSATKAYVYYDNEIVQTINLSTKELKEYTIKGYNGDVIIEAGQNKIRVKDEKSPLNICSKKGWVTSSLETIICLPNKVVIKIENTNEEIDTVVR
jgi:hypothetical protein